MKIEAVDFFHPSTPEVTTEVAGSLARTRQGR